MPGCQEETIQAKDEAKVVRRAYSIGCSVLDEKDQLLNIAATDWLEFYIVLVRDSGNPEKPPALTPRLFMLRDGDRIQLGEKIATVGDRTEAEVDEAVEESFPASDPPSPAAPRR